MTIRFARQKTLIELPSPPGPDDLNPLIWHDAARRSATSTTAELPSLQTSAPSPPKHEGGHAGRPSCSRSQ